MILNKRELYSCFLSVISQFLTSLWSNETGELLRVKPLLEMPNGPKLLSRTSWPEDQ
jgi:hypothetical protein